METLDDYLSIKETLSDKFLFRGQEQGHWKLTTSYQRLASERKKLGFPIPREVEMIKAFQSIRRFASRRHNLWDTIAKMQHYGVKTRMLDFTESMDVALFFALTRQSFPVIDGAASETSKSYILCVSKDLPNKDEPPDIGIDELEAWSQPREADLSYYLFKYHMRNPAPRVQQQRGVFLFSHNPFWVLAEKLSIMNNWSAIAAQRRIRSLTETLQTHTKLHLIEVAVTRVEFVRIQEYLATSGMDSVKLFPGSEGRIRVANQL